LQNAVTVAHEVIGKTIVYKEGLKPNGAVFQVANFEGSGKTLTVEACEAVASRHRAPNSMVVGIALGGQGSPCDAATTPATTIATTPATTRATTRVTTTPATTRATTADNTCPDTSKELVRVVWRNKKIKRSCRQIGRQTKKSKKRALCLGRNLLNQKTFERAADVCQQECAQWSGCEPAN
jgi:hypothetical protein